MTDLTPQETIEALYQAIDAGDLDAVAAFYEPDAVLLAQPHRAVQGTAAVKEALRTFLDLKPALTLESHKVISAADIAISLRKWTLKGIAPDGKPLLLEGTSTDVLRRQPDGRWLLAIDNPWGPGLLD